MEYNKDTCTSSSSLTDIGPYPLLNSVNQYYGYYDGGSGYNHIPLTYKPNVLEVSSDMFDYYYAWCDVSKGAQHTIYAKDGGVMKTSNYILSAGCMAIKITFAGMYTAPYTESDISHSILTIDSQEVCRYKIDRCDDSTAFYFQSYGGGYQLMTMSKVERLMKTEGKEVTRYQPTVPLVTQPYSSSVTQRKGLSIADKKSHRTIRYEKVINNYDEEYLRYLEDFLGSGSFYLNAPIQLGFGDTGKGLVKFLPEHGTLLYDQENDIHVLQFTGKINQEHNLPNYAV
jgi:hypothetical protein